MEFDSKGVVIPDLDAWITSETRYWRRLALGAGLVLGSALAGGAVLVWVARRLWS